MNNEQYNQAIGLSHFALEKIMKATLNKQEIAYPLVHDIAKLANIKYKGEKYSLGHINKHLNKVICLELIHGRWNVNILI